MAWYVVPAVKAMFRDANRIAPNRKKSSDGTIGDTSHQARPSDHNPDKNSNPPGAVRAGDITHDPAGGFDVHKRIREAVKRRDRRGKYWITNGKIISYYSVGGYPPYAERPYSGSNAHRLHGHTSVRAEYQNDDSPWWGEEEDELAGLGEQILAEVQAARSSLSILDQRVDLLDAEVEQILLSTGKKYPGGPSLQKAMVKYADDDQNPETPNVPQEHLNIIQDMLSEIINRQAESEARLTAIEAKLNEDG